jgi:hypothetical protein
MSIRFRKAIEEWRKEKGKENAKRFSAEGEKQRISGQSDSSS